MNNLEDILKLKKEKVEGILKQYSILSDSKIIDEACLYSLLNGGKRLRPVIMSEVYGMFKDDEPESLNIFMSALETIHSFSLVHDDLPDIDNDDLRRGKPTTHKVFGSDIAILTGDAMLAHAYKLAVSSFFIDDGISTLLKAEALEMLTTGTFDMIVGETIDVIGEFNGAKDIMQMYDLKTCKLIIAAFGIGGILAGVSDEVLVKLGEIGYLVGMAFQIQDDILDIEGNEERLGKPIGSDEDNDKQTFVKYAGIERSKKIVNEFSDKAISILKEISDKSDFLEKLVKYLVDRDY